MKITPKKFTIPQLLSREENIDLEPGFQRGKVWKLSKKQKFLDSLIQGWPIPKIFLRLTDENTETYQCIDGQQRLRTIFEFMNNKISLSGEPGLNIKPKIYKNLLPEIKDKFNTYFLDIDIIEDKDDNTIGEFYLRLNQGVVVNSSEKLKSIGGGMKNFVWDLSKTNFLVNKTSVKNTRDSFISICAQTCYLELYGIQNLKFKDLEKMFRENKSFDSINNPKAKKIKKTFEMLDSIFDKNTPEIKNRAGIISLYLLISNMIDKKVLEGNKEKIKIFFIDFQKRLIAEKEKNVELMAYQNAVIQAQDSKTSIIKRNDILTKYLCIYDRSFESFFPDRKKLKINPKDKIPNKNILISNIIQSMDSINKKNLVLFKQDNLRVSNIYGDCPDIQNYNFLSQELNKWLEEMDLSNLEESLTKEELSDEKQNKKKTIQILEIWLNKKKKQSELIIKLMREINLLAKSFARHSGKELVKKRDKLISNYGLKAEKLDYEKLWEKTLSNFENSLQLLEKEL